MARRVPRKDADLMIYADAIINGFKVDSHIFTAPPYTVEELTTMLSSLDIARDDVALKKSAYESAIKSRDDKGKTLHEAMVAVTEYCYRISKDDKSILASVGLTPRKERRPADIPGATRDLVIVKQEVGKVLFKWKHPVSGGRVGTYIVQRKETGTPPENWMNVWTAMDKEAELKDQPENQSFDYRVRALNHTGIGAPSNTVTVKF